MELLTVKELAKYLKVCPQTIFNYVHARKIPYLKIQGNLRFDLETLNKWIKSKEQQ